MLPAPTSRTRLGYIDGLRAIAVSLVLWFHAALPGLPSGFLGVDMFFVISGFLITAQVYDGLQNGRFALAGFYARRMLRLAPPLLLVLAAVLVAIATLRLLPADIRRIAESAAASVLMLSNWYFLKKTDYFAPSAEREPLLHLWSLGVEEQYYLFAPMAVMGLAWIARRSGLRFYALGLACTALIMLLSLGVASSMLHDRPAAVFFATPLRAWEFAVGGVAILALRNGFSLTVTVARAGIVAGLLAIAIASSLAAADPHQRLLLQAAVSLGAGAVLTGGAFAQGGTMMRLLSLRPMAALGLVSYALYLWHWPVLVLWRLTHLDPPSRFENVVAGIAIPLLLAVLTYFAVERPLQGLRARVGAHPWRTLAIGTAASAGIAVAALATMSWATGLKSDPRFRGFVATETPIMGSCRTGDSDAGDCRIGDAAADRVLLWGDSHAMSMSGAIARAARAAGLSAQLRWQGDCAPLPGSELYLHGAAQSACMARNDDMLRALSSPEMRGITGVVLDAAWAMHLGHASLSGDRAEHVAKMAEAVTRTLQALRLRGLRVLLVGPVPELPHRVPECLFLATDVQSCAAPASEIEASQRDVVAALRAAATGFDDVRFVDAAAAFCDVTWCVPAREGTIYYRDSNHLTDAGAELLQRRFSDDFAWIFAAPER